MFTCPHCRKHLERLPSEKGIQWRCASCEGRAVTIPLLRRMVDEKYVNQLWRMACDTPRPVQGVSCPLCHNGMTPVQHLVPDEQEARGLDVDVCRSCHSVWFDTHELDKVLERMALPPAEEKAELSQKAREIIALAQIESIRERTDRDDMLEGAPPADGWQAVLTIFGVPVEENTPNLRSWPWITWALLLLMATATGWALWRDSGAIAQWGLIPAEPFRHSGLTFLTSFFLHASLIHLIGNVLFLWIFGDNVEDFLGPLRYGILLVGSALTGDLLHMALEPRSALPLVGASGGISGVIAFYALQFPKARLVYFLRLGFFFRWVRFSAVTGFICWVALQLVGAWKQKAGLSDVSSLGHLGGAAFGLAWWAVARGIERRGEEVRGPMGPV